MKCIACDRILTEFESTRRSIQTGELMDLSNKCYSNIEDDVPALSREELGSLADIIHKPDE